MGIFLWDSARVGNWREDSLALTGIFHTHTPTPSSFCTISTSSLGAGGELEFVKRTGCVPVAHNLWGRPSSVPYSPGSRVARQSNYPGQLHSVHAVALPHQPPISLAA